MAVDLRLPLKKRPLLHGAAAAQTCEWAKPEDHCQGVVAADTADPCSSAPAEDQETARAASQGPSSKQRFRPHRAPKHAARRGAGAGKAARSGSMQPSQGSQATDDHPEKGDRGGTASKAGLVQHAHAPGTAAATRRPNQLPHEEGAAGSMQQADAPLKGYRRRRQSAMDEKSGCMQECAHAQDLSAAGSPGGHREHAVGSIKQENAFAPLPTQAEQQGAAARQPGFLPVPEEARRARSQPAGAQLPRYP